jgi:histidinol-phosphate aminotransferase
MDPLELIRADFGELEEYSPVKPLDVLAAEIGLPVERLVKLDANENLYGAAAEIRAAIAEADLHIYPDPSQAALRTAIAEYVNADDSQVVAGTGADELIDVLIRLVMPTKVAIATPTFGMYRFLAKIARAEPIEVPRRPNFDLDVVAIQRAVHDGASMVFLTSPNNPTGNAVNRAELEAVCSLHALVVVDEAYIEFGGESAVPLIAQYPNLVILRTFSKWAGLAGLRVGYAVADRALASRMMAIKQPYNVNIAADVAARAALKHRATIFETVQCIVAERDRMATLVARTGWLKAYPSQANFVLFAVEGRPARDVAAGLRRLGVLVRYYDRPDLANCIRISAGRPEDTDRLVEALQSLEAS